MSETQGEQQQETQQQQSPAVQTEVADSGNANVEETKEETKEGTAEDPAQEKNVERGEQKEEQKEEQSQSQSQGEDQNQKQQPQQKSSQAKTFEEKLSLLDNRPDFYDSTIPSPRLKVYDFSEDVTPEDLKQYFSRYGEVKLTYTGDESASGKDQVIYITMEDLEDAKKAREDLNNKEVFFKSSEVPEEDKRNLKVDFIGYDAMLFVGNLPNDMDEQRLQKLFEPYGTVDEVCIMYERNRETKGYGFVVMRTRTQSNQAKVAVAKTPIGDRTLRVDYADCRTQSSKHSKVLFVDRLPPYFGDDKEFRSLFEPYGKITECFISRDMGTGTPRGFGFVEYDKVEEAENAKAVMNEYTFRSAKLRVSYGNPTKSAAFIRLMQERKSTRPMHGFNPMMGRGFPLRFPPGPGMMPVPSRFTRGPLMGRGRGYNSFGRAPSLPFYGEPDFGPRVAAIPPGGGDIAAPFAESQKSYYDTTPYDQQPYPSYGQYQQPAQIPQAAQLPTGSAQTAYGSSPYAAGSQYTATYDYSNYATPQTAQQLQQTNPYTADYSMYSTTGTQNVDPSAYSQYGYGTSYGASGYTAPGATAGTKRTAEEAGMAYNAGTYDPTTYQYGQDPYSSYTAAYSYEPNKKARY